MSEHRRGVFNSFGEAVLYGCLLVAVLLTVTFMVAGAAASVAAVHKYQGGDVMDNRYSTNSGRPGRITKVEIDGKHYLITDRGGIVEHVQAENNND